MKNYNVILTAIFISIFISQEVLSPKGSHVKQ